MNANANANEFGPAPEWLEEAQKEQDRKDAEKQTDLYRCQQLVAQLRAAMAAAAAIMHRDGLHNAAVLLLDASGTDDRARAAVRALEEDAGYVAGAGQGEAYP